MTLLTQRLGLLKYVLTPLAGIIVGLGAAAFFTIRHFKNLADQNENLIQVFSRSRQKYLDAAKAIEDQQQALIKATERAADYAAWLDKLGQKEESLADKTTDAIDALREMFKLEQEIADANGQTKEQKLKAEAELRKNELRLLDAALLKEKQLADADRQAANLAAGASEKHQQGMEKNTADKDFYTKQIQEAQKAKDQIDDKTKSEVSKLQSELTNPQKTSIPQLGGGSIEISAAQNKAEAERKLKELNARSFSDIEVGGKKVRVSLDELDNIVAQATGHLKTLNAEQVELIETQRQLDNALSTAKTKAEKEAAGVIDLERKRDKLASDIAIHEKLDPQLSQTGKSAVLLGNLNNLQKQGAYTTPGQVALLDVNKRMEAHLRSIDKKMDKPNGGGSYDRGVKF